MNRAIFLDRDGTLIKDEGYQFASNNIEFLSGVITALEKFQSSGYKLIIVTNQSGIGRGYYSEYDMAKFNEQINIELKKHSVFLSAFYYCPHFEGSQKDMYNIKCDCRKPSPGLIIKAAEDYQINLSQSFMIGDKESDVLAGRNANVKNSYLIDDKHNLLYYLNLICDRQS
jgi:D-glycero-D-manno-heptose 1,7-bisphosphate phosphatase